ncbi:MAG: LEPR-XLL domain-containing protein, partial [Planctomycetota bacterium]
MSMASRAVQRLEYLYALILRRERLRNALAEAGGGVLGRRPRFEPLEQRLMLSGDWAESVLAGPATPSEQARYAPAERELLVKGLTPRPLDTLDFSGGSGDVISVDIDAQAGGVDYDILQAELTTDVARPLTLSSTADGRVELRDSTELLGTLVSTNGNPGGTPLTMSGSLYFAPATASDLTEDADSDEPGFQGQFELVIETHAGGVDEQHTVTIDVEAGHATTGEQGEVAYGALSALRVQQRLNYLGFGDITGSGLETTGVMDLATGQALQLFRAAVDADGTLAPADADDTLTQTSLLWLNDAGAPRWQAMAGLDVSVTEAYGTSWLIAGIQAGLDAVVGIGLSEVAALSTADGWSSADTRDAADPGRRHQAGMEVDFAVWADAQTASGGAGLNAHEQILVDLVDALAQQAGAGGAVLVEVATSNTKIVDAITSDPGLAHVYAHTDTESNDVMHVGLAAPERETLLTGDVQQMFLDVLDGLGDLGDDLVDEGPLGVLLPLVDDNLAAEEAEEEGGGLAPAGDSWPSTVLPENVSPTIGNILGIGDVLREEVYQPVADYFGSDDTPTIAELVGALGLGLPGITSVVEDLNTPEQVQYTLEYDTGRETTIAMALPDEISQFGITLDGGTEVTLTAEFSFDLTVGVDLTQGTTAADAAYVQVTNLSLTASADADMNFDARVGFVGASVVDGTIDLQVSIPGAVYGGKRLYLSDLQSTPAGALVTLTPAGTVDAELPISATIGGWSTPAEPKPTVTISDGDVFDGTPPDVTFDLPADLLAFKEVTPTDVVGLLDQLTDWLANFQAGDIFGAAVPFVDGTTLSDVLGLDATFLEDVTDLLESVDEPGAPAFGTAQELLDLIPAITGVVCHTASGPVLEYTFDLLNVLDEMAVDVSLDLLAENPLSHLADIEASGTVSLIPQVDMEFALRLDLSALGEGVVVDASTTVDEVVQRRTGDPIKTWADYVEGDGLADVEITLRDGSTFTVNLDSPGTLAHVVSAINSAGGGKITAEVVDKAIRLTDETTTPTAEPVFQAVAASGSLAGFLLGILASEDEGSVIEGSALHGDVLDNHVFVKDATIGAELFLTADNVDATARFGAVAIEIVDGDGGIGAEVTATLTEPSSDGVSFMELTEALDDLSGLLSLTVDAGADLNLPVAVSAGGMGLDGLVGADPV